jgi:hypothetical protein
MVPACLAGLGVGQAEVGKHVDGAFMSGDKGAAHSSSGHFCAACMTVRISMSFRVTR